MTPHEAQGDIWGGGLHDGVFGGQAIAGCLCTGWVTAVHWVGTLARMEGIRMTPMVWVSPLSAAGSTGGVSSPVPNLLLPGAAPAVPVSIQPKPRGRQPLAGSPLNVTNTV